MSHWINSFSSSKWVNSLTNYPSLTRGHTSVSRECTHQPAVSFNNKKNYLLADTREISSGFRSCGGRGSDTTISGGNNDGTRTRGSFRVGGGVRKWTRLYIVRHYYRGFFLCVCVWGGGWRGHITLMLKWKPMQTDTVSIGFRCQNSCFAIDCRPTNIIVGKNNLEKNILNHQFYKKVTTFKVFIVLLILNLYN